MSKNFANASEHPLEWPDNFSRTKRPESSRFDTSLFKALENVKGSISKFASDSGKKVEGLVISSNYSLTNSKPKDSGVAVYFTWDGEQTCIPVDRYSKVEDNLQAIFHCIEAERTKLRHGGINLVKAAFRGYAALPNPETVVSDWRYILKADNCKTIEEVTVLYKKLRSKHHPDKGGDSVHFDMIVKAYEMAKEELS